MSFLTPTDPGNQSKQRYGEDQDEVDELFAQLLAPDQSLEAFNDVMWDLAQVVHSGHAQALQEDLAAILHHFTPREKEAVLMVFDDLQCPLTHPALIDIWQELWDGDRWGWVFALLTCENLGVCTLEELKQKRAGVAEDRLRIFDLHMQDRYGWTPPNNKKRGPMTDSCIVVKPPTPFNLHNEDRHSIFLAGSIEMGKAEMWQDRVAEALSDLFVLLLNPRRDNWDSSWKQDITEPNFKEQVDWELKGIEEADTVVLYFDPATMSPITLLELGLAVTIEGVAHVLVCCPPGYWRRGNVQIVCARYGLTLVDTMDELIHLIRERVLDQEI